MGLEVAPALAYAAQMDVEHMMTTLALEVRAADYDRFLAIQLAPAPLRNALYALTAFNHELAVIAETVSEAMLGHIRLAWWREALEEIVAGKTPRNHPVVLALAQVYAHEPAVFAPLFIMIQGRAADLDALQLAQEADWLAYLDATAGALHQAWALVLHPQLAAAYAAEIATQARCYAMVGLVRAIPYMQAYGFLRFPHAMMNARGVLSLAPSPGLEMLVGDVVGRAEALSKEKLIYRELRAIAVLSQLCYMHIRCIKRCKYDPYRLKKSSFRAALVVLRSAIY